MTRGKLIVTAINERLKAAKVGVTVRQKGSSPSTPISDKQVSIPKQKQETISLYMGYKNSDSLTPLLI